MVGRKSFVEVLRVAAMFASPLMMEEVQQNQEIAVVDHFLFNISTIDDNLLLNKFICFYRWLE